MTKRTWISILAMVLGILCIGVAVLLLVESQVEEEVAQASSQQVLTQMQTLLQDRDATIAKGEVLNLALPNTETVDENTSSITAVIVDDVPYAGILVFPQLELELPVAFYCTDENLRASPCLCGGTMETSDLIIAGHNYQSHFASLSQLSPGDIITYVDGSGIVHSLKFTYAQTITETDFEALAQGTWDMTLFTCVYGDNTKRILYRFQLEAE